MVEVIVRIRHICLMFTLLCACTEYNCNAHDYYVPPSHGILYQTTCGIGSVIARHPYATGTLVAVGILTYSPSLRTKVWNAIKNGTKKAAKKILGSYADYVWEKTTALASAVYDHTTTAAYAACKPVRKAIGIEKLQESQQKTDQQVAELLTTTQHIDENVSQIQTSLSQLLAMMQEQNNLLRWFLGQNHKHRDTGQTTEQPGKHPDPTENR